MPLARHLENIRKHVAVGNKESAKRIADNLLRQYSRKADQAKIQDALNG